MPTFYGFNTIDQYKKFTLTDFELIKRDLLNALNIRQGEVPGKPAYGTKMWNLVYEAQTQQTQSLAQQEMQRVVGQDPRLYLESVQAYSQENGLLLEITVQVVGTTDAERLQVFFDQETRAAGYID